MAYIAQPYDPDELQGQPASAPLGQPPGQYGSGVMSSGGPTGGPTKGSNFPDLQRYLDMNQARSESLAGMVADPIEEEATETTSQIGQAQQGYTQSMHQANPLANQALFDKVKSDPLSLTEEEKQAFINTRKNQFGYNPFEQTQEYADLLSSVSDLEARGKALGSAEGRASILSGLSDDPTRGKSLFNELLLSGNQDAMARLGQATAATEPLGGALTSALEGTDADRQARMQAINAASGALMNEFFGQEGQGGYIRDWKSQLEGQRAAAEQAGQKQLADAYKYNWDAPQIWMPEGLSAGEQLMWKQTLANDFKTPEGIEKWTGTAMDYWRPDLTPNVPGYSLSAEQFANPEMFAREAALEELLGQDLDILQNQYASEAGNYQDALNALLSKAPQYGASPTFATHSGTVQGAPLYYTQMLKDIWG